MPAPAVRQRRSSERGAILIQVGIALVVLVGLSAFVTDYGVFWLARRQAQNAADAGALAGAVARVFDEQKTTGPITSASVAAATGSHWIIDRQVDAAWVDVSVPNPINDTSECPFQQAVDRGSVCVRVEVSRDSAHNSALPTYFARVFGKDDQDVRARAVAQVVPVSGARCLMPWMAPNDPAMFSASHIGDVVNVDVATGWWQADFGGATADSCVAPPSAAVWVSDAVGAAGDVVAGSSVLTINPTIAATIVAQDPGASWDDGVGGVTGSCAVSGCGCIDPACPNGLGGRISPRILPVGLYDLAATPAPLRNIAGLFVLPPGDPDCLPTAVVCGRLMAFPGELVGAPASFSAGLNLTPMLIQ